LLCRVQYKECPEQNNCFDCGIFAVAIILHLS
jgi:Ulp1 family protease